MGMTLTFGGLLVVGHIFAASVLFLVALEPSEGASPRFSTVKFF